MAGGKRILFGVFDWGLGHATRDTPLIQALLEAGHRVDVLATGRALAVLRGRFGDACAYHDVPSVRSPYTRSRFFCLSFLVHAPAMLRSLHRARKRSRDIIRRNGYDLVVSDCRYDVYDRVENSLLINHQIRFKTFGVGERVLEAWLARRMSRYGRVIVPDFPGPVDLSGELGHDPLYYAPERLRYIGILSHLRRRELEKDIDVFVSLTGPEPQRTLFEDAVLRQAGNLPGRVVVAGGKPGGETVAAPANVEYHGYLDSAAQEETMNRARFFVSRSGYTSMMELAEIGLSDALLVPTPGQTEQEYLADYYAAKGMFHHVAQAGLDLLRDIETARGFPGIRPTWHTEESVRRFLNLVETT